MIRANFPDRTFSQMAQLVKNLPEVWESQVRSLGQEDPLEQGMAKPTPVFLPGEFHGQRSLTGYSPWGSKELNTTERLTLSLTLVIIHMMFCSLYSCSFNDS